MGSVNVWGLDEGSPTATVDTGFINRLINSKVNKHGDEMHGNLQMNGKKISGLPINISQIEDSDATSYSICNEVVNNSIINKVNNTGDEMFGDLFLKIGNNNVRALGCMDLKNHTGFSLLLGSYDNQIQYERQDASPQGIIVLTSGGIAFQVNGVEFLRIGSQYIPYIIAHRPTQLMAGIDAHNTTIYNMQDPVGNNDAATKQYVDKKVGKCKSGLVPYLRANEDNKAGYVVSASSEHSSLYSAYKPMKYGSGEWANLAEKSNFWFKDKCLEQVRVWRFSALGRGYAGHELVSWIFEGSNDDADWTVLRSESNYVIGHTIALVDIDTDEYFQYYRLFIVLANGLNAGLAHFQLYVYNE